ncbi:putative disease resistance protein, partial [Mucuna pruriens]
MKEWEEWNCIDVTDAFPRLRSLSIRRCTKFKGNLSKQLFHLKNLEFERNQSFVASNPMIPDLGSGDLRPDYHRSTLKRLIIKYNTVEASLFGRIGHLIFDASLVSLHIYSSPKVNIPMDRCFDFLVEVEIKNSCDSLTTFPLNFFPKLSKLALRGCNLLRMISQGHPHNHLKHLSIGHCTQFESLPKDMHVLLPSLTCLEISYCSEVEFSGGGLPSNLEEMDLSFCSKLFDTMKGVLGANNSVKTLCIGGMDVESFPDEGLLPLSLTSLQIYFSECLKRLDYKGLCQLNSLEILSLANCEILSCLPEEGLPKSISIIKILNCPLLKPRLKKPEGEDWEKIAHIENIQGRGKIVKGGSAKVLAPWFHFPSTCWETLYFEDMKELEEWNCKDVTGAFPILHSLSINRCLKFKGYLPKQLFHLKDLEFDGNENFVNIPMNHCFDFLVEVEIIESCESLTTFPLEPLKLELTFIFCQVELIILPGQRIIWSGFGPSGQTVNSIGVISILSLFSFTLHLVSTITSANIP